MKKLSLTLLTCLLFLSPNVVLSETYDDLVKRNGIHYKKFSSSGVCMKTVDTYANPARTTPNSNSYKVGSSGGQCNYTTDCSYGFRCDFKYKVCVR